MGEKAPPAAEKENRENKGALSDGEAEWGRIRVTGIEFERKKIGKDEKNIPDKKEPQRQPTPEKH